MHSYISAFTADASKKLHTQTNFDRKLSRWSSLSFVKFSLRSDPLDKLKLGPCGGNRCRCTRRKSFGEGIGTLPSIVAQRSNTCLQLLVPIGRRLTACCNYVDDDARLRVGCCWAWFAPILEQSTIGRWIISNLEVSLLSVGRMRSPFKSINPFSRRTLSCTP